MFPAGGNRLATLRTTDLDYMRDLRAVAAPRGVKQRLLRRMVALGLRRT